MLSIKALRALIRDSQEKGRGMEPLRAPLIKGMARDPLFILPLSGAIAEFVI